MPEALQEIKRNIHRIKRKYSHSGSLIKVPKGVGPD
jgi:hypothetical protein